MTAEKLLSKGRVLTTASQVLTVNISEEVRATRSEDVAWGGRVLTGRSSSPFQTMPVGAGGSRRDQIPLLGTADQEGF